MSGRYAAEVMLRLHGLRPCPFCGGTSFQLRSWTEPVTKSTGDSVICMGCGAMGPMARDEMEACDEWDGEERK